MFKDWTGDDIEESIPDPQIQSDTQDHLARAANRLRQSTRPRDPLDLEFDLNHDYVPDGFLKADIQKHGKRQPYLRHRPATSPPEQSKVLVHRRHVQVSEASVSATFYD